MKKIFGILLVFTVTTVCFNIKSISFAGIDSPIKPIVNTVTPAKHDSKSNSTPKTSTTTSIICVKPLDVVNNPAAYLNKRICMTAKFAKFSTLGLDYKPAFRNSEDYITFLFYRDDVANNIPLSELKMFVKRDIAEKLPDIKENDTVKVTGTVFSNALGDAWFETDTIVEITK